MSNNDVKKTFKNKTRELEIKMNKEIPETTFFLFEEFKNDIKYIIDITKKLETKMDYRDREKEYSNRNTAINNLTNNLLMFLNFLYEFNLYEKCKLTNDFFIFFDLKTEKFLTFNKAGKKGNTEFKSNQMTIQKLIEEDLRETIKILLDFLLEKVNIKIKEIIKKDLIENIKVNTILKKIRGVRSFYSPFLKEGLIKKDNKYNYNLCFLPKYETEEKIELEEVYNILKDNYKYLYILLENLFVTKKNIKYILNFYAYILKTKKKLPFAIVIFGLQGAGKNVFTDFFLTKIFGEQNIIVASNPELQSEFNGFLINKTLIVFNEVAGDISKNNRINNTIKQIVTDPRILINEKNISRFEIDNYFNTLFFSNSSEPLKIEAGDRRFVVFNTKNKKLLDLLEENNINKEEYFKELETEADEFVKEYLAKMKTYYPIHYKTEEWFNILLKTNTKVDLFKYFFTTSFSNLKKFLIIKNENEKYDDNDIKTFVNKLEKQKMLSNSDFEKIVKILYGEEVENIKKHISNLKKEFAYEYRIGSKKYRTVFRREELLKIKYVEIEQIKYEIKEWKDDISFKKIGEAETTEEIFDDDDDLADFDEYFAEELAEAEKEEEEDYDDSPF